MTTLMRRNQNWLPSLFNEFLNDKDWMGEVKSVPAVNIKENPKEYIVDVAAPGMNKDDFRISIDDYNNLTITMEKKVENEECKEKENFLRKEFSYSKFSQAFLLPEDVDKEKIEAKEEHGILSITLPKFSKEDTQPKHRVIEIK